MEASVPALATDIYYHQIDGLILLPFSKNDKCQLVIKTKPGD